MADAGIECGLKQPKRFLLANTRKGAATKSKHGYLDANDRYGNPFMPLPSNVAARRSASDLKPGGIFPRLDRTSGRGLRAAGSIHWARLPSALFALRVDFFIG